jgi:hypothetical protein
VCRAKKRLTEVWELLNEIGEDTTTDTLLNKVGMTWDVYKDLYNVATSKVSIVMKRSAEDTWINNYNSTLLEI